jgi:serine/threonine protein kinase
LNISKTSPSFCACIKDGETGLSTPVGTLGYKAPELVRKEAHASSVDMWALGVIVYTMLCGFPPFFSLAEQREDTDFLYNAPFWFFFNDETPELHEAIMAGNTDFPEEFWRDVSGDARDFVSQLLQVDVAKRLTAKSKEKNNNKTPHFVVCLFVVCCLFCAFVCGVCLWVFFCFVCRHDSHLI